MVTGRRPVASAVRSTSSRGGRPAATTRSRQPRTSRSGYGKASNCPFMPSGRSLARSGQPVDGDQAVVAAQGQLQRLQRQRQVAVDQPTAGQLRTDLVPPRRGRVPPVLDARVQPADAGCLLYLVGDRRRESGQLVDK